MASVKYAISAYVADGTTTDYLITWDYLDEDHIAVYVDGTSNADPTASHTFSKLNDTTLRITDELGNAIAAGAEIEIRRETPLTTRAITFADGSALLASDLNKNSDYLLYSMQEVLDTVEAAAQDGALAAQVATEGFRDEAEQHKIDAQSARDTAQTYLATVQSDATDADNHRIAAAASEAAAATSEANAATSETNSANSATASANSASASATSAAASLASEQASAASETAAAASEVAAAASETAAAASATAAATSEANAAASFDDFDDRYLGAKASAPTVDNDGDALLTGALYWNTTSDTMYVWNGASWDTFNSTAGISDGASSTAVTIDASGNVGIGTSSVSAATGQKVVELETTQFPTLRVSSTSGTAIQAALSTNSVNQYAAIGTDTNHPLIAYTNSTERMRIDSSGDTTFTGNVESTGRMSSHIGEWQKRFVKSLNSIATFTYTSSYRLSWDKRIIGIAVGSSSTTAAAGYFDIECPPSGTTIHGIGANNSDRTASSAGIELQSWEALYYELPLGSAHASQNGNWHWGYYPHMPNNEIPDHWVLVAWVNGDSTTNVADGTVNTCCQGRRPIPRNSRDYPDSNWIYPSLGNGWTGYGSSYGSPRYRRLNNLVHFEGLIRNGTPSTSSPVFYFPAGFRPATRLLKITLINGGYGRLDVESNGGFMVYQGNSGWTECNFTFLAQQ